MCREAAARSTGAREGPAQPQEEPGISADLPDGIKQVLPPRCTVAAAAGAGAAAGAHVQRPTAAAS